MERLYRLAWRLTGRKAEAEDLFQELLIKAYGKLDDLVNIDEPGSWLARVMYNLFIDEQRRFARRRMHTVEESELSGDGLAGMPGTDDPAGDGHRGGRPRTRRRHEQWARALRVRGWLRAESRRRAQRFSQLEMAIFSASTPSITARLHPCCVTSREPGLTAPWTISSAKTESNMATAKTARVSYLRWP